MTECACGCGRFVFRDGFTLAVKYIETPKGRTLRFQVVRLATGGGEFRCHPELCTPSRLHAAGPRVGLDWERN
jgi:hypothetical protein